MCQMTKKQVLCSQIKLHREYFQTSRKIRCTEHVARMGERRDAFRVLQGTPERRRPLGRLDDRIILN